MNIKLVKKISTLCSCFVALLGALIVLSICQPDMAVASSVTVPIDGGSLTMDYTFTVGTPYDTFAVQSVTAVINDPSSGYFGLLPEFNYFTGFTALTAPTCVHARCLDDFGASNAGEAAGFNPPPIWAWFGSVQSYGYDSSTSITLSIFDLAFYLNGSSNGSLSAYLADSEGSMNVFLPDGTKTAIDFNFNPYNNLQYEPLPASLPLFASGLGVMGLLARRRKRKAKAIATA